jgi:uncharacterized protein DUF2760
MPAAALIGPPGRGPTPPERHEWAAPRQSPSMPDPVLTPMQRFLLAFYAFYAVLFRLDIALGVHRLREAQRAGSLPPGGPSPFAAGPVAADPQWTSRPAGGPPPAPRGGGAAPPAPTAKPAASVTVPVQPAPAGEVKPFAKLETPKPEAPAAKGPEPARVPDTRAALQLLAVLQREGRLVDFVEEDLAGFPDAAIGAAARTVHAGCKKALEEIFRLEPVYREAEGAKVTVAVGFDPAAIRLTGNVVGKPPFQGSLKHHGWRAREVKLPPSPDEKDPTIVAPAEVEL